MNIISKRSGLGLAVVIAISLAGCGSSGTESPTDGMGVLNLSISDGPIEAAKVCIKFDGVQLKKADDMPPIDFDFDPVVINLLANQGAVSETLVSAEVEAGTYEWVRLKVDAVTGNNAGGLDGDPSDPECSDKDSGSYLYTTDGQLFNIRIPSGDQTGLKLIKDIIVPVNSSGNYTAEWDLGMSFIAPPGLSNNGTNEAIMKPVVKLVANAEVGTLDGTVADELLDPAVCDPESEIAPSVYVYDDDGDPENPINGDDGSIQPVATGLVDQDMQGMPYTYEIGFLLAGNYDVGFTCDAESFVLPLDDQPEAIIEAGMTTTIDFEVEQTGG